MRSESIGLPQTGEWTPERVALVGKNAGLVIAGGILVGTFAAVMQLYWVAATLGVLIIALLVSWHFEVALVIYVMAAFVPWGGTPSLAVGGSGVGKGVYVSELMLAFLLVIWFGKYLLRGLPANRIRSGFYVPIALYLAYCVLNVVSSYLFWDWHVSRGYQHVEVNIIELGLHVLSGGALVMIATSISNRRWLTWMTCAVCATGVYNLLNSVAGEPIPVQAPWWQLVTLLPVGYSWAIVLEPEQSTAKRCVAAAAVVLAMLAIFVRCVAWVSGWLGLMVTILTVTFVKNTRLFAALLVVIFFVGAAAWPFLHENVVAKSETEGDYDRFSLMLGAVKYATTFPLGVGLGNYRSYNSFHYGQLWGTTSYTSAHGTYSQHLSEMGFVGLALFLAVLASGFVWMLREYRAMEPGPSKTFLLAAMGQLAGIACAALIGDYIIPTYHNNGIRMFSATIYSWLIWGLAIAHVRISRDERETRAALPE